MNINDLKSIYRHLKADHSISKISKFTGFDRKTVREYRDRIQAAGILSVDSCDQEIEEALFSLLPINDRSSPIRNGFADHLEELKDLLSDKDNPVKPKTAYFILKNKYQLDGSYESFKLFARTHNLKNKSKAAVPRLETMPGQETQLDYGKAGMHENPETGKRKVVYMFIAILSSTRLPFIQFVYSQDQESWTESNICMVEFYGGVTEFLTIDNLKSGVIKADVYDPQINRSFAEFAEHYGTFINPCIKGHSKGKAKVERMVPVAREVFRRLTHLYPGASLTELNEHAKTWCLEEYGQKKHGTTGIEPVVAFERDEKPLLQPVNPVRFEVPVWKKAVVHADQFLSFGKKRYALPEKYRKKTMNLRKSGAILKIFDSDYRFVRLYAINQQRAQWFANDFPGDYESMMLGKYPQFLIQQASAYGDGVKKLIESILQPHAFLNARRAKGMLSAVEKHKDYPLLNQLCSKAAQRRIYHPETLLEMLKTERIAEQFEPIVPRSALGEALIRNIEEILN